jgi:hypothetical protein
MHKAKCVPQTLDIHFINAYLTRLLYTKFSKDDLKSLQGELGDEYVV